MLQQVAQFNGEIEPHQLTNSGGKAPDLLRELLNSKYVEIVPHRSKIDPITNRPPDALAITPLGRDVLELDD
jgi:hypothetical protein